MFTQSDVEKVILTLDLNRTNPGSVGVPNCRYVEEDGSPSCIVGHIFKPLLTDLQWSILKLHNNDWVNALPEQLSELFDQDIITWLHDLQTIADQGFTWGQALRESFYLTDIPDVGITQFKGVL